jgi:transcriptional regulator with XRE-family HTH domain
VLKQARHVRELSSIDAARAAGIWAAYPSKLESDAVKKPSPLVLHQLSEADRKFNALYGYKRQLHWDRANDRQLDVFVGRFAMCHELLLDGRLGDASGTLRAADLLLTKLQVVELNPKDVIDALALIEQHSTGRESDGDVLGLDRIAGSRAPTGAGTHRL